MMFLHSFLDHSKYKQKLLDSINNMSIDTNTIKAVNKDKISRTDFFLPKEVERPYLKFFNEIINPITEEMCKRLNSSYYEILYTWFQQYNHGDVHNWHNHTGSQFANVFFVELEDNSIGTEFLDPKYNIKVKEGDLITFPSYLYHRSPINLTQTRKTIISFNSSFSNFKKNETKDDKEKAYWIKNETKD